MKLYAAFLGLFAYGWYGYQILESGSLYNELMVSVSLITAIIIVVII